MGAAACIGLFVGMLPPRPDDDDDDHRRRPPRPEPPPKLKPPGADIVRDLVKDVKDEVPETEETMQR
jgi:hypothetical protein